MYLDVRSKWVGEADNWFLTLTFDLFPWPFHSKKMKMELERDTPYILKGATFNFPFVKFTMLTHLCEPFYWWQCLAVLFKLANKVGVYAGQHCFVQTFCNIVQILQTKSALISKRYCGKGRVFKGLFLIELWSWTLFARSYVLSQSGNFLPKSRKLSGA